MKEALFVLIPVATIFVSIFLLMAIYRVSNGIVSLYKSIKKIKP